MNKFLILTLCSLSLLSVACGKDTSNLNLKEKVHNQIEDAVEDAVEENEQENEENENSETENPYSTTYYEYVTNELWDGGFHQELVRTNIATGDTEVVDSSFDSHEGALRLIAEPDDSDYLYFRWFLPGTDAPMGTIYSYDTRTNTLEEMAINDMFNDNSIGQMYVSPDEELIAWVPYAYGVDSVKIYGAELSMDRYRLKIELPNGETLDSVSSGMNGSYEMQFIDNDTLEYSVYESGTYNFIENRETSAYVN